MAVSGLLLQTFFRNSLVGLSILGISDGANLGVALVMLLGDGAVGLSSVFSVRGSLALIVAAFAGACSVLGLIIYFSTKVRSNVMLLIIGIMVGYTGSCNRSLTSRRSSNPV